jgi:membrane protein DedA with SNARE-associated domain
MSDALLGVVASYGIFALFLALTIAAIGIPLPGSLMLLATGSFAAQGEVEPVGALVAAVTGAVLGDNIGYAMGRWGGRRLIDRITARIGGASQVASAEAFARRWSGLGVFLSRWLLTPLGPCVNITSGISHYPWPRFLLCDVAGQLCWVLLYGGLGYAFSDHIQTIAQLIGNVSGALAGFALTGLIGYLLYRYMQPAPPSAGEGSTGGLG